jgi:putative ATP-dependent endonuclease of the OLD family
VRDVRAGIVALVDGDAAGNLYVEALVKRAKPPEYLAQWPVGWEIEDIVGWVLGKDETLATAIQAEYPVAPASINDVVAWLKTPTNEKGAKTDFLAHEAIASAILTSDAAKTRVRSLLRAFVEMPSGKTPSKLLEADVTRSTAGTSVWRFALES